MSMVREPHHDKNREPHHDKNQKSPLIADKNRDSHRKCHPEALEGRHFLNYSEYSTEGRQ